MKDRTRTIIQGENYANYGFLKKSKTVYLMIESLWKNREETIRISCISADF